MLTLPEIVERPEQAYLYVPFTVTMDQMQRPADEGFPMLFTHIEQRGLTPVGPAFYNYPRINMAETLDVEAGIAVSAASVPQGPVKPGLLPAGRYATTTWHGHPDKLIEVTAMLITWVNHVGQRFDMEKRGVDDFFACRLELYESDPSEVPNMDEWVTTLAFKLAE